MTQGPQPPGVKINGPALRCVRELRGQSIGALARAAGCSTSFLARVERGVQLGVSARVFEVLTAELGLTDARAIKLDPYESDATPAPAAA